MKQLLIRADDLGYSYAVNLGLARTIREGLVRSAGLMPNMPTAEQGWGLVRDLDFAIGQHTNFCLGTPCADPVLVPSLVDEHGKLHSSRAYRAAYAEGRDFVVYEEALIEAEAQLARFRQIVGKDPDYFEAHAVESDNLNRAIHEVAERHGLKEQPPFFDGRATVRCGQTDLRVVCEDILPPEAYDPMGMVRRVVEGMADGETWLTVFHPGYLDAFILENSSLTTNRTREVDVLTDPKLHAWLEGIDDLRLVDYRDL